MASSAAQKAGFVEYFSKHGIHSRTLINGSWVSAQSNKIYEVINPATEEVVATVPNMDEEDAENAMKVAHSAFQHWKERTGRERSRLLRSWHNLVLANLTQLAEVISLENGKPLTEALREIESSADILEFNAEEAKRLYGEVIQSPFKSKQMFHVREPVGVVGMLTPWNLPVLMIIRKISTALAAGCTCVVKPAEDTPLSAIFLVALAKEAGIPDGVINVITCDRHNAPAIGQKLCQSPNVAAISFTAVGKILYTQCASTVKRISLELGGNAPFIVFESADLDNAVIGCMASKFRNNGQMCISVNRVFVHESLQNQFILKMVKGIEKLKVGNGLDETTLLGPLINKAQFNKISAIVNDAVEKGAKIVTGGKPHLLGKTFYEPTILVNVNSSMRCYTEEIFGPVLVVRSFKTESEVVEMANDTRSGLVGYFYSNDMTQIRRVARNLEFGMVGINEGVVGGTQAAFGGIKESGIGREGSKHGLDEFTNIKYLCLSGL